MDNQEMISQNVPEFIVTLAFSDKREIQLSVRADETVIEAGRRHGLSLRSECELGTCGTCKAQCASGEYVLETVDGLTTMEKRKSYVLACAMQPRSACKLNLHYPSTQAAVSSVKRLQARVADVTMVSRTVCRYVLELKGREQFEFLPGQYVNHVVPGSSATRAYSFANSPIQTGELVFFVRLLPYGLMSDFLRSGEALGTNVELVGPYGSFYLRDRTRPILMVAGGTGLAPMLSMLQHLVDKDKTEQHVKLLFGVNTREELFCISELDAYKSVLQNFQYEVSVVSANEDWTGKTGYVTDLLTPDDLLDGDLDVYVCGPPPMAEAVAAWLERHGTPEENVHTEKFLPNSDRE